MEWPQLDVLVDPATGRGDYQRRDLSAHLDKAVDKYLRSGKRDLSGFRLPLFADVGTGKTPSTLVYLRCVREFLLSQGDERGKKPILVVTPANAKFNWVSECRRWRSDLGPLGLWIIDGTVEERKLQFQFMITVKPQITIINYDLMRIHADDFQNLTPRGKELDPYFLCIVCDEVHYVKWRKAARAHAVNSTCAHFHIGLTGTPMTNKPDSLWNVVTWLDNPETLWQTEPEEPPRPRPGLCPLGYGKWQACTSCMQWSTREKRCKKCPKGGKQCWVDGTPERQIRYRYASNYWGREWPFKERYCLLETNHFGTRVVGPKLSAMPDLHDRLTSWGMVRWRRAEVLNMESIAYEHISLEPSPEQADIYGQLLAGFIEQYGDDLEHPLGIKQIRAIIAQLMYFRRSVTLTPREFHLALAGSKPAFAPDLKVAMSDSGAKQEWLLEFMESELAQEDGHKAKFIILSEWTSVLEPLGKRIAKKFKMNQLEFNKGTGVRNPADTDSFAIIDGSTPSEARFALSERWNSDQAFRVILGSGAIFEAINLQGGMTEDDVVYVVVLNMPWMPYQVVQGIGRAWRFGQRSQVVALFPTVAGTIDEKMVSKLFEKQKGFDLSIDGGEHDMAAVFEPTNGREILDLLGSVNKR